MKQYKCTKCGYIYDEEKQEEKWKDLSEDWSCPLCHHSKNVFVQNREDIAALEEMKRLFKQGS